MKHFIVNFTNIGFDEFKSHGGGDFAIRLVEYLIAREISFSIINNKTKLFENYSNIDTNLPFSHEVIYFDPLYVGNDDNSYNYKEKFLFIHGLRMLEMGFDNYSYKYFYFPHNILNYIKFAFFKKYYKKNALNLLNNVKKTKGKVTVLTPSEHSKYIFKSQPNFELDVKALPPFLNNSVDIKSVNLPFSEPYILLLNADRWVKNSYRFLKAFTELVNTNKINGIKLLLVGIPKFSKSFEKETHFIDYVERDQLEWLMKNCLFLAYPSLNEGFGYPPIDCMKYGRPTLCTSISAPNIVCDGNVLFTSPFSQDEMKSRILLMLNMIKEKRFNSLPQRYISIKNNIDLIWSQIIF